MFKLNEEFLMTQSNDEGSYKAGVLLEKKEKIGNFRFAFNFDDIVVEANVKDRNTNHVHAEFSPNGYLKYTSCDCSKFGYWGWHCKHVTAVMIKIMNLEESGYFTKELSKRNIDQFIKNINKENSSIKTPLRVEVNIEYNKDNDYLEGNSKVWFKIGEKRLYVAKDIIDFVEAVVAKEKYVFGKNFTFDSSINEFSHEDQELFDFIKKIIEIDKLVRLRSDRYISGGFIEKKYIYLTNTMLTELLEIINNRKFNFIYNENKFSDVLIKEENIDCNFKIEKLDGDISIKVDSKIFQSENTVIIPGGNYIFFDGEIIKVTKDKGENLKQIAELLVGVNNNIVVESDKAEKVLSLLYPILKEVGDVTVDQAVKEKITTEELSSELYLNKDGEAISGNLKFIYGEITINPFEPKSEKNNEKIILRNYSKENEILNLIEKSSFEVQDNNLIMNDEDDIYSFIIESLPNIQNYSSIFYSDDFKKIKIRSSKSVSSRIQLGEKTDFLSFDFKVEGLDSKDIPDLLKSMNRNKKYYRLKDGSYLPLDLEPLTEFYQIVEDLDIKKSDIKDGSIKLPKHRAFYIDDKMNNFEGAHVRRDINVKELILKINDPIDLEVKIPSIVDGVLRDYQEVGFKWLQALSDYGFGGILADDMGLGKTLQVLAHIQSQKEILGSKPTIIVAPYSLLYNWETEVNKFTPGLKTKVICGAKLNRKEIINTIADEDIIITSYPLIRKDIELYEDISFRSCILDEAQHIKNHNSKTAKSVKQITSDTRFALTGTPIENSLAELWSIFDFLMPGYLHGYTKFRRELERPIVAKQDVEASKKLEKYIRPFIIRRLKTDVLEELPEKIESNIFVELTQEQKQVYTTYLEQAKSEIDEEISNNGFNNSRIKILAVLTRLRQICCDPKLFIESYNGGSSKLELLDELLDELIEGGHRVLIFSQFTSMLAGISKLIKHKGLDHFYLDGSTDVSIRHNLVNDFNNGDCPIFLISLKAGGTGLNLTGADTVIHFDPWWNPAVEMQATDRAYRIGQEKVVHAMKIITKGTIEEKICELQAKKKKLFDDVIKPGEKMISKMNADDIRDLFD